MSTGCYIDTVKVVLLLALGFFGRYNETLCEQKEIRSRLLLTAWNAQFLNEPPEKRKTLKYEFSERADVAEYDHYSVLRDGYWASGDWELVEHKGVFTLWLYPDNHSRPESFEVYCPRVDIVVHLRGHGKDRLVFTDATARLL